MYVGRDFDPIDTGEEEVFTLDFSRDVNPEQTIADAVVEIEVAAISEGEDETPGERLLGARVITGYKVSQKIGTCIGGVIYCVTMRATTSTGEKVSLWAHVECMEPA